MPKLKLNAKFKFNPMSLMDETTILQNMQIMRVTNIDSETIIDYAREHGLSLREGAEIEEMIMGGPQIQDDGAPSRQRENKKSSKMSNNLNQKGVSAEGKKKLESKQQVRA